MRYISLDLYDVCRYARQLILSFMTLLKIAGISNVSTNILCFFTYLSTGSTYMIIVFLNWYLRDV